MTTAKAEPPNDTVGRLVIRPAEAGDAATILRLIRELAVFEKLADQVRATEQEIRRSGFGARPAFECLLAERAGEALGFALFFPNYSTFEARAGLYLEDLYVSPEARGTGIGKALLARLAALALERGCPRLDLSVLDWNPAREVYRSLGFEEMADWRPYRLSGDRLSALARQDS
ncbi:MAG: GNAT family N-acetyltransferase [Kiloniellales bacterium]